MKEVCGIPLLPIFRRIHDRPEGYPWGTWFAGFPNSVPDVCPPGTTERRARALMKVLDRLGYVTGCHCGCRGEYELTEAGEALRITLERDE